MKIILLLATLVLLASCNVKPPTDADKLGEETTAQDINSALASAQSGVPEEQAYHVGDNGTIEKVDKILTNSGIVATVDYKVTGMDKQCIYVTKKIRETGESGQMYILRKNATGDKCSTDQARSVLSLKAPAYARTTLQIEQNLQTNLFKKFFHKMEYLVGRMSYAIRNIEFQRPTALGQELNSKSLNINAIKSLRAQASSSRYFGLTISKHTVVTANCAQIPDCKVEATRIEFDEILNNSGKEYRFHWLYEISKEVPGLFMVLSECYSTIVKQDENQIPLTECLNVKDFRFGN